MIAFGHIALILGGLLGATGVGLGAFGAHALKASLDARGQSLWQTASLYHLLHAAALVAAAAAMQGAPLGGTKSLWLILIGLFIGTLLFSGSLYALALGAPRDLGAVTPLGGVALMVGWLALAWLGWQRLGA